MLHLLQGEDGTWSQTFGCPRDPTPSSGRGWDLELDLWMPYGSYTYSAGEEGPGARRSAALWILCLCSALGPAPSVAAEETSSSSLADSLLPLRSYTGTQKGLKRVWEKHGSKRLDK